MSAPPLVVAEFGQCKGHVGYAIDAIKAARRAGCWAVKIQLLRPERIARADAPVYWQEDRPGIDGQRATFETAGCLPYDEVGRIVEAADAAGVELMATPFDLEAVEAMREAKVRWCKVASGDLTNRQLIEGCADAWPDSMVLSTGAATLQEVDQAVSWMLPRAEPWAVLACTLAYPTENDDAHLSRIATLAHTRDVMGGTWRVGYSDHTRGITAAGLAVAGGATVLEKHATLDVSDESVPDNGFALPPGALALYVDGAEQSHKMMGRAVLVPVKAEYPALAGARRVICAAVPLVAGDMVTEPRVIPLRPWHPEGWSPADIGDLLGRRTREPIAAGEPILRSAIN